MTISRFDRNKANLFSKFFWSFFQNIQELTGLARAKKNEQKNNDDIDDKSFAQLLREHPDPSKIKVVYTDENGDLVNTPIRVVGKDSLYDEYKENRRGVKPPS